MDAVELNRVEQRLPDLGPKTPTVGSSGGRSTSTVEMRQSVDVTGGRFLLVDSPASSGTVSLVEEVPLDLQLAA